MRLPSRWPAEVKGFDSNEYFGKRDAKHLDPCVQFAMAASDEAMHDAGFDVEGAIDRERLGVYVGSGVGGMTTLVDNVHTIAERGPRRASPYMIAMMIPNMASGNIAIRHKAKGPTLPVVTACATSAHAVGEAFRAIKHGYADAILAGGAEAAIIPDAVAGFTSCRALTTNPDPATACRPFDADRDGFVMGEGACVLVLESMEHAQARGAHIYAEVVGYGNTDDAYHITSPDPEAAGIARAISLAVTEGDVKPSEGLYINAHGTSTKLNDSSETTGIKRALGEDAARAAHVSSTKSMTGHMIGATAPSRSWPAPWRSSRAWCRRPLTTTRPIPPAILTTRPIARFALTLPGRFRPTWALADTTPPSRCVDIRGARAWIPKDLPR